MLHVREQYPRWGKDKLAVVLRRAGWTVSTSMVGRILAKLKARGVLREAPRAAISTRKRAFRRPYAVRKPKGYAVDQPGDLVQVDTLDVRPVPGVVLKHFTARDIVSRWDVLEARTRATAATAAGFLDRLVARMPFPVRAIQVDGGSEFQAVFEEACQARGIRLFVLPPRSPKLNGCVERAQRTHTEEFYEVTPFSLEIAALNRELLAWEAPTTPSGRTRPSAISPRPSSSTDGQLNERRPSVTNVLNEYNSCRCPVIRSGLLFNDYVSSALLQGWLGAGLAGMRAGVFAGGRGAVVCAR